jgi:hypothetical protein
MDSFSFEYLVNMLAFGLNENREKNSVELSLSSYDTSLVTCSVRGNVVFKALCYKPEGRGFETRPH